VRGVAFLDEMRARAPWLDLTAAEAACEKSQDAIDALIAALVTRAATTGRTRSPEPADQAHRDRIEREGWIHLPAAPGTFEDLLSEA
jgi:hypothetical protein